MVKYIYCKHDKQIGVSELGVYHSDGSTEEYIIESKETFNEFNNSISKDDTLVFLVWSKVRSITKYGQLNTSNIRLLIPEYIQTEGFSSYVPTLDYMISKVNDNLYNKCNDLGISLTDYAHFMFLIDEEYKTHLGNDKYFSDIMSGYFADTYPDCELYTEPKQNVEYIYKGFVIRDSRDKYDYMFIREVATGETIIVPVNNTYKESDIKNLDAYEPLFIVKRCRLNKNKFNIDALKKITSRLSNLSMDDYFKVCKFLTKNSFLFCSGYKKEFLKKDINDVIKLLSSLSSINSKVRLIDITFCLSSLFDDENRKDVLKESYSFVNRFRESIYVDLDDLTKQLDPGSQSR